MFDEAVRCGGPVSAAVDAVGRACGLNALAVVAGERGLEEITRVLAWWGSSV
jgi:hypothetical protein